MKNRKKERKKEAAGIELNKNSTEEENKRERRAREKMGKEEKEENDQKLDGEKIKKNRERKIQDF